MAGILADLDNGSTKIRGHPGPYWDGTLFRWAEYHQSQFWQRFTEQSLGLFALSILNGKALQEGSTTQEYRKFLRTLGTAGPQHPASNTCPPSQKNIWLALLGNVCSLLLVCWLGGQLWYNGSRILGSRGPHVSLGMFL